MITAISRSRLMSAAVLLPLLVVTAVVRAVNLVGAPQRIDDEGTYVAQAFAILRFGEVTHYTYWYDHPPLGWIQIAGWMKLLETFGFLTDSVAAGRQLMVVVSVVAGALLWTLVRRLGYGRVAAGAAVALLALSPLAVGFNRTVYLDNLATAWVLAALVCMCTPQRRLAAYIGAAASFGIAVLTKETFLLLLPAVAWLGWQRGNHATRRYAMAVAGTLFGLLGSAYVLTAAVRSELIPGEGHVSLIDGIAFQLLSRTPGGSVFTPGTNNYNTVAQWVDLDWILVAAGLVAALVALAVRQLRPIAAGYLLLAVMMLRGGYLPVPYVIVLLPLAALLVATVAAEAARRLSAGAVLVRAGAVAVLVAVAAIGVAAVPPWGAKIGFLTSADQDAPTRQARQWLIENVPRDQRLIVDDVHWADLVRAGWDRDDVGWFYKLDTDPAVQALSPKGFIDYDYIVATEAIRLFPASFAQINGALTNSQAVATFGAGSQRVEIRRIGASAAPPPAEPELRTVGAALADRLADTAEPVVVEQLRAGRVDARVLTTLGYLATVEEVLVADLPEAAGEDAAGRPRRQVLLIASGARAERIVSYFKAQRGAFEVQAAVAGPSGVRVVFAPAAPSGLLAAAATPPAQGKAAALRVLNLVTGSGPLQVRLAGIDGTATAPIPVGAYGDTGIGAVGYHAVPSGVTTLGVGAIDPALPTALSQTVALAPGSSYTLMLFTSPDGDGVRGQLVPDPAVPGPDLRGIVRLVHGAAKAPELTVASADAGPLAQAISYGLVTGYAELIPGTAALTLTSGAATSVAQVPVKAGGVATLVVIDGPDGPVVQLVQDPVQPPAGAALEVTPPARPGVLAPVVPSDPAAPAEAAAPPPPVASDRGLGDLPLMVIGWALVMAAAGFWLRRRKPGIDVAAPARPAPLPAGSRPLLNDDETVQLIRRKPTLGRAPRPPRPPDDPDNTMMVEQIEAMRAAAAREAAARAAVAQRPNPAQRRTPAPPTPAQPPREPAVPVGRDRAYHEPTVFRGDLAALRRAAAQYVARGGRGGDADRTTAMPPVRPPAGPTDPRRNHPAPHPRRPKP